MYLEILETQAFDKVLKSGDATREECEAAWEAIIRKNYEMNGGYDYMNYIDLSKGYASLMAESNLVCALLLKLVVLNLQIGMNPADDVFVRDDDVIAQLKELGFKINTTDKKSFIDSLNAAFTRSRNFNTRIKMKANELQDLFKDEGQENKRDSFDQLMALLIAQGIQVNDDLTLSRYNELTKIFEQRNKQAA